jgi:acyl-CoA synthetase (NDP forming)
MVTVANPLDYHTFIWADRVRMGSVFSGMMAVEYALTMLVLDFPRTDRCDGADWDHAVEALKDAAAKTGAAAAIVSTFAETLPEEVALGLIEAGIVPLCGFDEALAAAEIAADIGAAWAEPAAAPMLTRTIAAGSPQVLDEAASKALLVKYGLAVPAGEVVEDEDAACRAAVQLGFPVVLKALGIAHKSEAGAVAVGLADEAELRAAFTRMHPLAGRFLVERMAAEPVAELIVGVSRDAVAGPVMTIGAGGVLVELIKDSAVLTLPTTREAVIAALEELALWKLLAGYRGRPRVDIEAVAAAALAIGRFVADNAARIEELDVNPLFVLPEGDGVVAVDALISMRGEMR